MMLGLVKLIIFGKILMMLIIGEKFLKEQLVIMMFIAPISIVQIS